MGHWFEKYLVSMVSGFIGIIFTLVGAGFLWGHSNTQNEIRLVEQIPLVTATRLMDMSSDTSVAIEGRVSERNTSHNGLVVYTIFQYRGYECDDEDSNDCEEVWLQTERVTPALWLDLPDGRVRIGNNDYWAFHEPKKWQTTENLIEMETLEYRGFPIGSPVFVLGKVSKTDGVVLNADILFGGSRQDYLDSQTEEANVLLLMGVVFGGFGLLFITIAIGTAIRMR